ncbi:hypothetical protein BDV41DRAFT_575587 [Aspergillus transmontanensis]|uniref:Heat shock protein 70 family n=1 Tax=Aspergillus transmontanensis TaxID=1034304 RepID=A0A5N6W260_9EURO|nr:hypothetical protein BDV41DRAFT_575587 [Aspergillus transmontanensis]
MTNRSQISVGIDFGTTYSGIAWSVTGVVNDIEVVSEWPGRGNKTTPKAPTTICYEGAKDVIFGVKLLLDEYKPIELRLLEFARVDTDIRNSINLMVCYSDTAPDKVTEDVFKLCTIEFGLNGIPPVLFKTKKNSKGVEYYRIEIVARLTPTSASLLFEMEFEGVPYGSITAKY